ncbi:Tn7-like element transposition protein TnsE [Parachitinimonas caeni]|uniref:Tn7-like element transposition protein TnsE n=1 Tax=Parachitinimonas caeni TaxID=3031301 RepID=A0ABT7DSL7_9NEIS|nr:Tn7-like element transposition protein TnsE [Parachitinimonas caeni]MDK2123061.1 Tn7-like element transposition protein TnsE [Parachitinimonas caeni]
MKFKDLADNSTIKEIGSLFRRLNSADWYINIKLAPNQKKLYFSISQIPVLARRRVLNPTEELQPAGFLSRIAVTSTRNWKAELIKTCPISAVNRAGDSNQWCFVFEHKGTRYYLPQLELARVLFFHHAYIARLSMNQNGLLEEFDIQCMSKLNKALINILPTCTFPLYARADYALRRTLAWILLDDDARQSFESIARFQVKEGYDTEKYHLWRFQFNPPLLEGAELTIRGHFDQNSNVFFVYEVYGVSNLFCNCPAYVDFFDPRYTERQQGQEHVVRSGQSSSLDVIVDDEQEPDLDKAEQRIETAMVAFEFRNPFFTTRGGKRKGTAIGGRTDINESSTPAVSSEVSTNDATVKGCLSPADYDGVDDQSADTHLYADKFEAFEAMVTKLAAMPNCHHVGKEIRKLPRMEGYSKYLLADGNPRCMAFHLICHGGATYALLEVDTSDNRNSLSTLLLKQPAILFDWRHQICELEKRLLKLSLAWPTALLDNVFGVSYRRIPHQRMLSESKMLLEQDSIHRWAERVYSEMISL